MPATQQQIETALQAHRSALAALHEVSRIRDKLCRINPLRLDSIADINAQIAAKRAAMRAARAQLAQLLGEP